MLAKVADCSSAVEHFKLSPVIPGFYFPLIDGDTMKTNSLSKHNTLETFEGGKAANLTAKEKLEHLVCSCLLWEDTFYENGESIVDQISKAVDQCSVDDAMQIATKAKFDFKLRHAPLFVLVALANKLKDTKDKQKFNYHFVESFLTRADDMGELVSLYKKVAGDKAPIPNMFKKAIAKAFEKFSEYQLAKYSKKSAQYKLVDLVNLCHPKASEAIGKLVNGELETPDTWEVAISAAGNDEKKKASEWKRLLTEDSLPDMAFLMNIRNIDNNVSNASKLIVERIEKINCNKLLPIVFLRSGLANERYQVPLENKFFDFFVGDKKTKGKTAILVDISGSMDLYNLNYAYSLAMIAKEKYEDCDVFSFSNQLVKIKDLRGFKLLHEIDGSQGHCCTYLWNAIKVANEGEYDRIIVITDEQSHDSCDFKLNGQLYLINIASSVRSVECDKDVVKITGFSDRVFDYIDANENK